MIRHEILVAEPAHRNGGVSGSARRIPPTRTHLYKAYKARRYPNPSVSSRPLLCPPHQSAHVLARFVFLWIPTCSVLNSCEMRVSKRGNGKEFVPFYWFLMIFSTIGVVFIWLIGLGREARARFTDPPPHLPSILVGESCYCCRG